MDWIIYVLIGVIVLLLIMLVCVYLWIVDRVDTIGYSVSQISMTMISDGQDRKSKHNELKKELKKIQDKTQEHREYSKFLFRQLFSSTRAIDDSIQKQVLRILRMQRRTLFVPRRRRKLTY